MGNPMLKLEGVPKNATITGIDPGQVVRIVTTETVTRNEILYGLNQRDKFMLAIVLVDGDLYEGPFYVIKPLRRSRIGL